MYTTDVDNSLYPTAPPSVVTRDARAERLCLAPRPRPLATAAALLLADLLALALAVTVGAGAYTLLRPAMDPTEALRLLPFVFVFPLGFAAARLYFPNGLDPVEEVRRLTWVTSGIFLVLMLVLFLLGDLGGYSRGVFLAAWGSALVLIPLLRALCRELFARRSWWGTPVVILGAAATADLVVRRLLRQPGGGLKPVACFDDDPAKQGRSVVGVPVVGDLDDAREVARALGIRHAVVAMPGVQSLELAKLLQRYSDTFPYLFLIPNLFGLSSLSVSAREIAGVVGLYTRQNLLMPSNRILKRGLDLALLLPIGLVAAPLVAVLALGVMMVSPGNPFYAQEREGYRGKRIRVWKLRTMYRDADAVLERHLASDPEARAEWERFYKLKDDPRVLPLIGPLLRKSSLDELPQLWNIALGQMSFVGPRPFPYYHLERFDDAFRELRRSVRPGLTGLWQVSARSDGDLVVQEELDSYYIRNWSLWMDLYLIARTPWAVFIGKGAR